MLPASIKTAAKSALNWGWTKFKNIVTTYIKSNNICTVIGAVVLVTLALCIIGSIVAGLAFCFLAWPLIFPILINWIFGTHITIGWITWIVCVILINIIKVLFGKAIVTLTITNSK
jgi:hypothetical protein